MFIIFHMLQKQLLYHIKYVSNQASVNLTSIWNDDHNKPGRLNMWSMFLYVYENGFTLVLETSRFFWFWNCHIAPACCCSTFLFLPQNFPITINRELKTRDTMLGWSSKACLSNFHVLFQQKTEARERLSFRFSG